MKKFLLMLGIISGYLIIGYQSEAALTTLAESGSCGRNCEYIYKNGSVYLKATGDYAKAAYKLFAPKFYENYQIKDSNGNPISIKNVYLDGAFYMEHASYFGDNATIQGINGSMVLTGFAHHPFESNTFAGEVIIPANATFGSLAFHGVTLADGAKIYCAVENCAQKIIDSCKAWDDDTYGYRTRCLNAAQTIISDEDKFEQAPEGCDFWSSEGCSKCTNSNYSLEYGYCYRKRYTLPEADAATSDDNENMIEWIFE